jgi:hypothetical protein
METEVDNPRQQGLGRLILAVERLAVGESANERYPGDDIRSRLIACINDFEHALRDLKGKLPTNLESEMTELYYELERCRPSRPPYCAGSRGLDPTDRAPHK